MQLIHSHHHQRIERRKSERKEKHIESIVKNFSWGVSEWVRERLRWIEGSWRVVKDFKKSAALYAIIYYPSGKLLLQ